MVKTRKSKPLPSPSSSRVRTFFGTNPLKPTPSPKPSPHPHRLTHLSRSYSRAIQRRSQRLRHRQATITNTAATPIDVDHSSSNTPALSQGESPCPNPITIPFSSPVSSPPPKITPLPIPEPPSDLHSTSLSSDDEDYIPTMLPSSNDISEDVSVTADLTPSPPSSPLMPRRPSQSQQSPLPVAPSTIVPRKYLPGKVIGYEFLTSVGLSSIASILEYQGWTKLFSAKHDYYPALMEQFYASLTLGLRDDYGMLRVSVCLGSTKFEFTSGQFGVYLGIPCSGFGEYFKDDWTTVYDDYDPLGMISRFTGQNVSHLPSSISVTKLNPSHRVLNLIAKTIVPRAGGRNVVTAYELLLMDLLVKQRFINLPAIILQHMYLAKTHRSNVYPYGLWLTVFFHHIQADLTGSIPKSITESHILRPASFSLMGIPVDASGRVVLPDAADTSSPSQPTTAAPLASTSAGFVSLQRTVARMGHHLRLIRSEHNRQYRALMAALRRIEDVVSTTTSP